MALAVSTDRSSRRELRDGVVDKNKNKHQLGNKSGVRAVSEFLMRTVLLRGYPPTRLAGMYYGLPWKKSDGHRGEKRTVYRYISTLFFLSKNRKMGQESRIQIKAILCNLYTPDRQLPNNLFSKKRRRCRDENEGLSQQASIRRSEKY